MEMRYGEGGEIAAAIEDVFDYRLDFARTLPEYNPNVANMRRTDGGTHLGVGASYAFDVTFPQMGTIPVTLTVIEVDHPSLIADDTGSPPMMAREEFRLSRSDGGTHVEWEVAVPLPDGFDESARKLLEEQGREQMRTELDLMKKLLEP